MHSPLPSTHMHPKKEPNGVCPVPPPMSLISNSVNYEYWYFNLDVKLTANIDNPNYKMVNSCWHSDPTVMGFNSFPWDGSSKTTTWQDILDKRKMPHCLTLCCYWSKIVTKVIDEWSGLFSPHGRKVTAWGRWVTSHWGAEREWWEHSHSYTFSTSTQSSILCLGN